MFKKRIGVKFVESFEGKSAGSAEGETGEKADGEEEQRVGLMEKSEAGGDQIDQGADAKGELVRGNERHESAEVEGGAWDEALVLLNEHGPAYTADERQRAQNSMVELHRRRILKHVPHPTQVQHPPLPLCFQTSCRLASVRVYRREQLRLRWDPSLPHLRERVVDESCIQTRDKPTRCGS